MVLTANVSGMVRDNEISGDDQATGVQPHRFAPASRIEVVENADGVFLFCYDRHGKFAGDTWHSTVEEAKMQAKHRFGIAEDDWRVPTEEETPIFPDLVKKHFAYLTSEYGFVIVRESGYGVTFEADWCIVAIGPS